MYSKEQKDIALRIYHQTESVTETIRILGYALYDKVYRDDVLIEAWKRVKANKGSSGVDDIRIEDIEKMGIEKYLKELKKELIEGKYIPCDVWFISTCGSR